MTATEFQRASARPSAAPGATASTARSGGSSSLYDVANERDGCGVALVARIDGVPTHETLRRALGCLCNLEHRGAEGADPDTGDGAGIAVQIPERFFRAVASFDLPEPGRYGVLVAFLPQRVERRVRLERLLEEQVRAEGQCIIGWRDVPFDGRYVGRVARESAPVIRQLFIAASGDVSDPEAFERSLYVIRRSAEIVSGEELTIASCSARTVNYKGLLTAPQLGPCFADLRDPRFESALALVHSRFSTNTSPSWRLAQPFRLIAHNGEINTITGNVNWMGARESALSSELLGPALQKLRPLVRPQGSDSATLDNALELLVRSGRSLPHAVMMLLPQAWQKRTDLAPELVDFYRYHASFMEPWDGPSCLSFTDGRIIGATLDRNGLRPGRWAQTSDGWVVLASEAGAWSLDESLVTRRGRLKPGQLFVVDLERHAVFADGEVEREVACQKPYGRWHERSTLSLDDLPALSAAPSLPVESIRLRQLAFGWTRENVRVQTVPLARKGKEPNGSMGNDSALAVLSNQSPSLFRYFKQRFAQVTNPPIDPVREALVMSLATGVGPEGNVLDESPHPCTKLVLDQPILTNAELARIAQATQTRLPAVTLDVTWPRQAGAAGLKARLQALCEQADEAIERRAGLLILSDRALSPERVPIPSLLAVAAVHHHLVRSGRRLRVGLIVESGEPSEVHHVACLLGYGAGAVNPYLLLETVPALVETGDLPADTCVHQACDNVIQGLDLGLLKVLSKMGISTLHSYTGAQAFEAIGLDAELIRAHFPGTASNVGGVDLELLASEALARHARAYPRGKRREPAAPLPAGGLYSWRRGGEVHLWSADTVPMLRQAVTSGAGGPAAYRQFADRVDDERGRRATLRGLLTFASAQAPVALDEVEPARAIVRRFATGAMSLGSISPETHEALAIAMNRVGGKSNTGEGGEDPMRFLDERRSAIKQVASGRFGVTIDYLVNADQIQIKIAQGAKPGEGGQLPGHKVSRQIAALRHSTPGVELISPPPHHDIYSIEDLKQLIYDLRCANSEASISVKLVASAGVGTVAAGVVKANADHIVIAGHDGGTGSSPLSSIQHAGIPWELGLAEVQQTLVRHNLRSRVTLQADGQMKTGRDVVVAALLGAEEVGFSTAPLIALGCIMMRVCHLNTCPVGIATQDPVLRRRFAGAPEDVINYLFLVAEDVREIMARLGVRRFVDLIGRVDLLQVETNLEHEKARRIDLSAMLAPPAAPEEAPRRRLRDPCPVLDDALDHEILARAKAAVEGGEPVSLSLQVENRHRAVGGLLSSRIARLHGRDGLPRGTLKVRFDGSAGQSFGAWLAPGVEFTLSGEANDYVGKGLSGGVIAIHPAADAAFVAEDNVIVGNTVLYGATSGRAFFRGRAGQRFAVRNSGASVVVEGVGDHGCEYMTGGVVVVLGPTGYNFAAGMSGGIACVHDPGRELAQRTNPELVDIECLEEDDFRVVRRLLEEHLRRTQSTVAERLLESWGASRHAFSKVMPRAFKQALYGLVSPRSQSEPTETSEPEKAII